MDAPTLTGLLVTRGLLDRARDARDGTAAGEVTALVLLDLAVESAAKALLGEKVQRGANFRDTIKALNAEYETRGGNGPLPGTGRVLELRDYRNGVQHAGNIPAPDNVDRFSVYASDFLDAASERLAGVPLQALSRASLVADGSIKAAIEHAEAALAADDFERFGFEVAVAFELVLVDFRDRQPWRRRGRLDHYRVRQALQQLDRPKPPSTLVRRLREALIAIPGRRPLSSQDASKIADAALAGGVGPTRPLLQVLQDLVTEVEFLSERVEAATVVGDPAQHTWFRARVGRATRTRDPSKFSYVGADPPLRPEEAPRAVAFVVESALRLEQLARSPVPTWSTAGRAEQRAWEAFKEQILELGRANERGEVTIDDIVMALDDPTTDRVEPAISELIRDERLEQLAAELFRIVEDDLGDDEEPQG